MMHGVTRDSRVIEWFVALAYFPHGVSDAIRHASDTSVGRHPEHVVLYASARFQHTIWYIFTPALTTLIL
jgi:hypothetical protein